MLASPITLLARLPLAVRLLVLGTFINKAGSFIVPFLTIVLRREFQLSDETAGALVAAYGFGSIISILVGGTLTDRLGRRSTLLVSLFGSGLVAVAMGMAPSLRVFVPLLVLFGFIADLYRPASAAMISDLLPSSERPVGFAALRLAVNLGFAVGMFLGGVIAELSWRLLCALDGFTTLVFAVFALLLLGETRPTRDGSRGAAEAAAESPWRDRVFLQMMAASFVFCCLIFIDLTVLPLTITMSAGYPAYVYGLLVGTNGVLIALFEVSLVDWLRVRHRRLRVAALGAALSGIGFGATGLVMHWTWFLATVVLWTIGEILVVPQQNAFIADWAPPAARGRYLGLYHATWSLGLTVAPLVFLPIHARMSERAFWGMLTVMAVPLCATLLYLDRTADRPERLRGASEAGTPAQAIASVAIASEAEG